jgi:glucosylceramidase
VNNLCSSPIIVNIFQENILKNPSYFYIGHFSKYIKPGAVQLASTVNQGLFTVAFENPNGSKIVVIQNEKDKDFTVDIQGFDQKIKFLSKAHSISTIII